MGLVRAFEERAVDKGNQSLIKEASTFAEEMGISLELSQVSQTVFRLLYAFVLCLSWKK